MEAGQSAGLVDAVLPAAEVVERIVAEYRRALSRLPLPAPAGPGPEEDAGPEKDAGPVSG
ncbi:hypothetical protein [Streptomyces sp. JW3]|uniref:hypothetical protein n=1 Tax=Streptomyces sp. JW3 TaxID=3456955 RepID=UPI003FA4225F